MCDSIDCVMLTACGRDHALAVVAGPALPRHVLRREHPRLLDQLLVEMAVGAFERADEGALLGPALPMLRFLSRRLRRGWLWPDARPRFSRIPVISPAPWNRVSLPIGMTNRRVRSRSTISRVLVKRNSCGEDNAAADSAFRQEHLSIEQGDRPVAEGRNMVFQDDAHGNADCSAARAGWSLAALPIATAAAQSLAEFYKGKTVDLYIGYSVGGGYDLYARMIARHLGKHIPGNPTVVPKNMEGAGSLRLANWLYNVAPKDGTAFGIIGRGTAFDPLLGQQGARNSTAPSSPGSAAPTTKSASASPGRPAASPSSTDLLTKELVVGGTSASADTDQFPTISTACSAPRFKIVTGYPGGNEVGLAMERGEVQGRCGWSWSSVKSTHQKWLDEKKIIRPGAARARQAPRPAGRAADHRSRQDRRAAADPQADLRPAGDGPAVPGAAGLPPDRAAALRQAFMATMKDKEFLAEAERGEDRDHAGLGRRGRTIGDRGLPDSAGGRRQGRRAGEVNWHRVPVYPVLPPSRILRDRYGRCHRNDTECGNQGAPNEGG